MNLGQQIYEAEKKDKILICGFAGSKKHVPWGDESWWTWGCNDLYAYTPRVDVTFEIHHILNMGARRNPEHEAVIRGGGKRGAQYATGNPATPIFMQETNPDYPTVIAFPKEKVLQAFGETPGGDYFTNSISWMIALAILELTEVRKVNGQELRVSRPGTELAIYGISMAADSEYAVQRPSVEHWVGRAIGCGLKVTVPDDAHILKTATLYGYASSSALSIRLQSDLDDLKNQTIQIQTEIAQAEAVLSQKRMQLEAIRGTKSYIDTLQRNLTVSTEIPIGSAEKGPHDGRNTILTLEDGKVVENLIVPASDNQQLANVGGP